MAGLLSGLTVLELGDEAGEWIGRLMADMGAQVIRVEPPTGSDTRAIGPFYGDQSDPELSLHFWHYNAGKQSITLSLEIESGREMFHKLAARADVLVESLPPGRLAEWGLGYEALAESNPGLVMTSITPFGQSGPRRDWSGTNLTLLAVGGPMNSCGYDDPQLPPVCAGNQAYQTGGHYAIMGVLLALIQRRVTGRGQHVDVPIQACLAVTTEGATHNWFYIGKVARRQTGRHASPAPTGPWQHRCADGHYINLNSSREGKQMHDLFQWLTEEGITEDDSEENQGELIGSPNAAKRIAAMLGKLCAQRTADEMVRHGQSIGMALGVVRQPEDWLDDPHAAARQFFVEVEHPEIGRTFRYPGPPYRYSNAETTIRQRPPHIGEHNESVYATIGLTAADLEKLRGEGTV